MANPQQILRELAEAAILWRKTKNTYLALSEKKPATDAEVVKARKLHLQAVVRLDQATAVFEKLPAIIRKGKSKPINWKKIVDGVAGIATAVSKATDSQQRILDITSSKPAILDMSKVIDAKSE